MNAPVADMSLVSTSRTLVLLGVMAFSLAGSLAENLLSWIIPQGEQKKA